MARRLNFHGAPETLVIAALTVAATLIACLSWVGYIASDDALYYFAAKNWLAADIYAPTHFGALRLPVIIPTAVSISLFGDNEIATVLPSIAFFVGTLLISYLGLSRSIDRRTAIIFSLLYLTTPVIPLSSTILGVDLPILFFSAASFWLFILGSRSQHPALWLLSSGVMLGIAVLARETAGNLSLVYLCGFAVAFAVPRQKYVCVLLGALAVGAMEALYYGIGLGMPLLRLELLQAAMAVSDGLVTEKIGYAADGNFRINPFVDPVIKLLIPKDFGFVFWIFLASLPGYLNLRNRRELQTRAAIGRFCVLASLIWIVGNSIALADLELLARYYILPAYFALIAGAIRLGQVNIKSAALTYAAGALPVGLFVLVVLISNKDPLFPERALSQHLRQTEATINVDPRLYRRVRVLLDWHGIAGDRVTGEAPSSGDLYFYVPTNQNRLKATKYQGKLLGEKAAAYGKAPGWTAETHFPAPVKPVGRLLKLFGTEKFIPPAIWRKLYKPNTDVTIYRVP